MPKPTTNFKDSNGNDLGSFLITKEYLSSVYPQIDGGQMQVWGLRNNGSGELGTGDNIIKSTPAQEFTSSTTWKQVTCGYFYTSAIKTDGTLWSWGSNNYAQLGTGGGNTNTPVQVGNDTTWKHIGGGFRHNTAIKTDGTLWSWGQNSHGCLGINDTTNRSTPVQEFTSSTNWKQVHGGDFYTAAVKTDGTLWTWGRNFSGQLGVNDITSRSTPVQEFTSSTNWKSVKAVNGFTMALKTNGTLWLWGYNYKGDLGMYSNGFDIDNRLTPVQEFTSSTNWKDFRGRLTAKAAIKTDGTLWVWGDNNSLQLGLNDKVRRISPVQEFTSSTNWRQVGGSNGPIAAIKTDGTLWTWPGLNLIERDSSTPTQEGSSSTNWIQVADSRGSHTVVLKANLFSQ